MEIIKFVQFYAMEALVASVAVATLLAGLYQFVRGKLGAQAPAASHRVRWGGSPTPSIR